MDNKRYLILEDGTVFEGKKFGADKASIGELVFTTGMNGYIETLTDPSYFGQIVLQTFPLIGNYGIIEEDFEGECCVKGYVVREKCGYPSNFRCESTLDSFLKKKGIPAIYGVDTRQITRIIREHGVMNAIICDAPACDLDAVRSYKILDAVKSVSCKEKFEVPARKEARYSVALIDYGAKKNIIRELNKRGASVTVFPNTVTADEILEGNFDGVMLSTAQETPPKTHLRYLNSQSSRAGCQCSASAWVISFWRSPPAQGPPSLNTVTGAQTSLQGRSRERVPISPVKTTAMPSSRTR